MVDYSRYQFLKVEKDGNVAIVTLNRPEVLNAIHAALHRELEDVFVDLNEDREVGAIVLTGAGRAFSAGGDARAMSDRTLDEALGGGASLPLGRARRLILNMLEVEQPMIAAVNGPAAGLGATIALYCDIVVMAEGARIGDTHVRMGLVAGDGGVPIWPLLVGINRAKEHLMLGTLLDAREAERIGLVNHVVPPDQLMPTALDLARRLANGPRKAIQWTKFALNKWLRDSVNLAMDTSTLLEAMTMASEDHKEAARAFVEKREPRFTGR
ncbi:putative enoyl-CoA hydratase echA8 [bacterium HR25]|jgi:enoyl-CoA hydratase/carnithine racemase|nr:putative enoyl-CoA hydratase echA8 [bacterium HR25]